MTAAEAKMIGKRNGSRRSRAVLELHDGSVAKAMEFRPLVEYAPQHPLNLAAGHIRKHAPI
jgi:hypothetical protein